MRVIVACDARTACVSGGGSATLHMLRLSSLASACHHVWGACTATCSLLFIVCLFAFIVVCDACAACVCLCVYKHIHVYIMYVCHIVVCNACAACVCLCACVFALLSFVMHVLCCMYCIYIYIFRERDVYIYIYIERER